MSIGTELARPLLGRWAMALEPPNVTVTEPALAAFRAALEEGGPGDVIRLSIDARFYNDLSLGSVEPSDVVVTVSGITMAMDASTARRADGATIGFVEDKSGSGFKFDNPNQSPLVKGIRPADVRKLLARGERLELVDVRDPSERARAKVDPSRLLDAAYESALGALPKDAKLVFLGHHSRGGQSAAQRFFARGFTNAWYVVGGIDAWSTMDPSVPRY